jgi:hypothetical protein
MKRNRVVWISSTDPSFVTGGYRPVRPTRSALRRALRTGALLVVIGLMRLAGHPGWRSAVIGAALTIPGVILRDTVGDIILLPGLLMLGFAPFLPGESRENRAYRARLRRELAAYSSPADRRDLEAILEQYPADETGELRAILADQSLATTRPRVPGMGHF